MPIRKGPYTNQPTVATNGVPSTSTYTAGEDIPGNSIVRVSGGLVFRANCSSNPFSVLGMTAGAATVGTPVIVVQRGPCGGVAGLVPDATYFLNDFGVPGLAPPATGVMLTVGTAQDANTFNIKIGSPVLVGMA